MRLLFDQENLEILNCSSVSDRPNGNYSRLSCGKHCWKNWEGMNERFALRDRFTHPFILPKAIAFSNYSFG
jgi:hypothetical protein